MPVLSNATLVIELASGDVTEFPLLDTTFIIGKSTDADIVIDHPYVSRRHAAILHDGVRFHIHDLGSTNGTSVNGEPLGAERRQLRDADRIELAGEIIIRFSENGSTLMRPALPSFNVADLVVDSRSRDVRIHGNRLDPPLSRKEFDILSLLYRRKGDACSSDEIAAIGWPERTKSDVADQDIAQYIRRLRQRIEPTPSQPRYIVTVRGYGYKLAQS
jgi:DNA-binding winged helix-turn-helix (wHTH) protein